MRKSLDLDHTLQLIFSYTLGAAVVDYSTGFLDWNVFIFGLLALLSLSIVIRLVEQFFFTETDLLSRLEELLKLNEARKPGDGIIIDRPRYLFLMLAVPFLILFFLAFLSLYRAGTMHAGALFTLLLIALLNSLSHNPPLHLTQTRYRDLIDGFSAIVLAAGFGNLLQYSTIIDLTTFLALTLLLLYFALRIVQGLESYDEDERMERDTFLNAVGWEMGMRIHNLFLLISYLILALAFAFFSLPWELLWPLLLNFVFVLLQVLQMIRVHNGAPVNWRLLRLNAYTTFYFFLYLAITTLFLR